jgi:hypothetical protein
MLDGNRRCTRCLLREPGQWDEECEQKKILHSYGSVALQYVGFTFYASKQWPVM